jgi:hypothetical protein
MQDKLYDQAATDVITVLSSLSDARARKIAVADTKNRFLGMTEGLSSVQSCRVAVPFCHAMGDPRGQLQHCTMDSQLLHSTVSLIYLHFAAQR